jgi:hypothetical protein
MTNNYVDISRPNRSVWEMAFLILVADFIILIAAGM